MYFRTVTRITVKETNRSCNCVCSVVVTFTLNYLSRMFVGACSESKGPRLIALHSFLFDMHLIILPVHAKTAVRFQSSVKVALLRNFVDILCARVIRF